MATTTKSGTKADLQQLNVRVPKEPLRRVADLRVRDRQHHQRCRLRAIVDFLATAGARRRSTRSFRFYFADGRNLKNTTTSHDTSQELEQ